MLYADLAAGKVLLVNKPLDWTSFDVVNKLKWALRKAAPGEKQLKIGHAGTLDPLATGLLIICTGKETKNIDRYQAEEKEYTGTFVLGATTPSGDLEEEIDARFATEHINLEMISAAALKFTGTQLQTPPVFSAVKVDGKRAYKFARKGKTVEIKPKEITISTFEITSVEMPKVNFRVVCSKGTYIRSLAVDFGKTLNSGAHLSALCRTRIGAHHLTDAFDISVLEKKLLDENLKTS